MAEGNGAALQQVREAKLNLREKFQASAEAQRGNKNQKNAAEGKYLEAKKAYDELYGKLTNTEKITINSNAGASGVGPGVASPAAPVPVAANVAAPVAANVAAPVAANVAAPVAANVAAPVSGQSVIQPPKNAPASLNELHAALRNNGQNSIGGLVNSISAKVSGLLTRARDLKNKIGSFDPSTINPNSLAGIIKLVNEFKSSIINKLNPLDENTELLAKEMREIDSMLNGLLVRTVNNGTPQASTVAATALAQPTQAVQPVAPVKAVPAKTTFLGRMMNGSTKRDNSASSYDINSKPIETVLADIENNIWKGYVYPSKGILSSSKPTQRELELIKKVIYKINEKLEGSVTLEDKKNTLYNIFNGNAQARSFLEHAIRYFSDTIPLYSFLTKNLLTAGVLVKDGGTPSLPVDKDTIGRNSTQNGYFGTKSTVIPDKDKNNKGWIELFNFIRTAGAQRGGSRTRSKSKSKSKSKTKSKTKSRSKTKSKTKSRSKSKTKSRSKTQRR